MAPCTGATTVGFCRVITDRATFAYVSDVFVDPEHRGQGIGKALMRTVMAHPHLQDLRRWLLVTADAHGLYAQHGFEALATPERFMERCDADVYARLAAGEARLARQTLARARRPGAKRPGRRCPAPARPRTRVRVRLEDLVRSAVCGAGATPA